VYRGYGHGWKSAVRGKPSKRVTRSVPTRAVWPLYVGDGVEVGYTFERLTDPETHRYTSESRTLAGTLCIALVTWLLAGCLICYRLPNTLTRRFGRFMFGRRRRRRSYVLIDGRTAARCTWLITVYRSPSLPYCGGSIPITFTWLRFIDVDGRGRS
jgi:hypothetical protein